MKSVKRKLFTAMTITTLLGSMFINSPIASAATTDGIISDETQMNGGVDFYTSLDKHQHKYTDRDVTPSEVILTVPFETQETDYYCGPASAAMVVNTLGYHKTQDQMAELLGTTVNGTNAGNGVANALNAVVRGSKYGFTWEWQQYYEVDKMKNHVVQALSYGNPVMVNTMESPGDVYLRGHNMGINLYHFGVIGDYFNYGNEVTYVDPGYGRYNGFLMNQRVSIQDMSYAAGGRGYAW